MATGKTFIRVIEVWVPVNDRSTLDNCVLAFLSAMATPIVRRFDTWLPDASGERLQRLGGFCKAAGRVDEGAAGEFIERGQGTLGRASFTGVPAVGDNAASEPGAAGAAAGAALLGAVVALPVLRDVRLQAVVAGYF